MARKKAKAKKTAKKKTAKKKVAKKKVATKVNKAKKKIPNTEVTIILDTVNFYQLSSDFWYFLPFPKNKIHESVLNSSEATAILNAEKSKRVKWGWAAKRKDVKKPLTWEDWDAFFSAAVGAEACLLITKSKEREDFFSVRVATSEIAAASTSTKKDGKFKIGNVKIDLIFSKTWLSKK